MIDFMIYARIHREELFDEAIKFCSLILGDEGKDGGVWSWEQCCYALAFDYVQIRFRDEETATLFKLSWPHDVNIIDER